MKTLISAMSGSSDGFALIDSTGHVIFWNNSLEIITGISFSSAKSQTIWKIQNGLLLNGNLLNKKKDFWRKQTIICLAQEKNNERTELNFTRRDGSQVVIEMHFHSFIHCNEVFFCVFINDITKRKQIEISSETALQVLRHDLISPLQAIMGFSSLDLIGDASVEELLKYLQLIHKGAETMDQMAKASLLLGRMEQGEISLEKEATGLFEFINDLRKEYSFLDCASTVNLKVIFDHKKMTTLEQSEIKIERSLFKSLLINLLRNAAEASPSNHNEISLSTSWEAKEMIFAVNNFGEVPLNIQERLFQKYATSGKFNGNGLGLYSAKLIALAHGGNINYYPKDGATTFLVSIPA